MRNKIYFSNHQDKEKITFSIRRLIKKAVFETLKEEKFPAAAEVSVTFVDNEEIHTLNREYREKDKPTDVLSFPMWEPEDLEEGTYEDGHAVMLGDIILSVEKARAQAEEYGHSIKREVGYLTIHSVLHLLGYDHLDEGPMKKQMRAREEAILADIVLSR